ncbi:MAG: hypothetical protein WBW88_05735 [Rhodothermales bacterium]
MKLRSLVICANLLVAVSPRLSAQSSVVSVRVFPVWYAAATPNLRIPAVVDTANYRPRAWKTGALIGAGVGILAGTIALTNCDPDSNDDCPGWGRVSLGVLAITGLGTLIGGLFPR